MLHFHRDSNSPIAEAASKAPTPEFGQTASVYRSPDAKEKRLSIKQRFTSSWAQKRRLKDDEAGPKSRGPLGLRLLHASPEPLIDLIFVHGLRGASIKTWQKGQDLRLFWPQFWLPMESELHHVSIHSFGYDADWKNSNASILDVHDFGRTLFEEMRNSPHLRGHSKRPIIMLGHSMGGLVIKKAFVLSQEAAEFQDRIQSIFFLATPHKGSDYAGIFKNILSLSGIVPSHQYIADLTTNSGSAQLLNEEFGKCADNLRIHSFFETLPVNIGITSAIIVKKTSAILGDGYKNERIQYMNANHKDICKFDSQDDPNYISLRNALVSATQALLENVSNTMRIKTTQQINDLKKHLGVVERQNELYHHVEGSCRWVDSRDDFQEWRDSSANLIVHNDGSGNEECTISIYWVHANPGTGKSYLASHVISELQAFKVECAYYFFHSPNTSSLAVFFRSVCYQMASANSAIREKLLQICEDGFPFDKDDALAIWTRMFKKGILQAPIFTTQYLVIDGLDECHHYREFLTMLKGATATFPLRIFITSRNMPDMPRLFSLLESSAPVAKIKIPRQDSIDDIERYIRSRIGALAIDDDSERQDIANQILERSGTSFLWARLVMDELQQVYSQDGIMEVLQGIPEGMMPYYERNIRSMADNMKEKHISKAVLSWVVGSTRKLTIDELSNAIEMDTKTRLPSARGAIVGLCGSLVILDERTGIVDLVHPTAREFLLSPAAGEFTVSKPHADQRVVLTCLQLLASTELQPPRKTRAPTSHRKESVPSPLFDYAVTQFTEHLLNGLPDTEAVLLSLDRFFETNPLSWIENIAQRGDLYRLTRAAKNLKAFIEHKNTFPSLHSLKVQNIEAWAADLGKLVSKFGPALLKTPASIHTLIPPFCPSESGISTHFGKRPDRLAVVGARDKYWNDCIAKIEFGDDTASCLSCGDNFFTVGAFSGDVILYGQGSFRKERVTRLKGGIDLIHAGDDHIVACTTRMLRLMDLKGNIIWQHRQRFRCMLLASTAEEVFTLSQHGLLIRWDLKTGDRLDEHEFPYRPIDSELGQDQGWGRAPSLAAFSPDLEVLALAYQGGHVCLWDLGNNELIGWAHDDGNKLAAHLIFNPNPSLGLLLVIYTNHDFSLYESWTGSLVHTHATSKEVGLLSASSSPDGRTLATIDTRGKLQVWDFESLTLLYHVLCPHSSFHCLSFTSDGSSIIDIMDSSIHIWSPPVLIRKNIQQNYTVSQESPQTAAVEGNYRTSPTLVITALCSHPSLPMVFAGKHTGEILAFSTRTGQQISLLYSHSSGELITCLAVSSQNTIASSDAFGIIQAWTLVQDKSSYLQSKHQVLQRPTGPPVKQLCFTADGSLLLASTTLATHVYSTSDGSCISSLALEDGWMKLWRWLPLPEQDRFLVICGKTMKLYDATGLPTLAHESVIDLAYELPEGSVATSYSMLDFHNDSKTLVLEVVYELGCVLSSATFLFHLDTTNWASSPRSLTPIHDEFSSQCRTFLGFTQRTKAFVILQRDAWVSTTTAEKLSSNEGTQHFFVPNDYVTNSHGIVPVKTAEDDIVFCLHGELAVVRNGLRS